jgi:hypothetical protein
MAAQKGKRRAAAKTAAQKKSTEVDSSDREVSLRAEVKDSGLEIQAKSRAICSY